MARKNNTFEGSSNGTTITTGNSDAGSGDAFNVVTINSPGTVTYDSSTASDGAYSAHVTGDTASTVFVSWNGYADSAGAMRFTFKLNSIPSGTVFIGRIMANADASRSAQVAVNSSAQLLVADAAGTTKATFTGVTLSTSVWYEAELESIIGGTTTTGTINCRLRTAADPNTILASYASGATVNAGTTTISGFRLGQLVAGVACDLNFDSYSTDNGTSNPIGPVYKIGLTATAEHPGAGPSNVGRFFLTPRSTFLIPDQTINAASVVDVETVGNPVVTTGDVTVNPAGIASGETVGGATVSPGSVTVSPFSIPSSAAAGFPVLTTTTTVNPASVPSGEAVGAATVTPGAVTVSPASITSSEQVGVPTVLLAQSVNPASIPSAEKVGTATVAPGSVTVSPASIPSGEAVGAAGISSTYTVSPYSIPSSERVGNVTVTAATAVNPYGISSAAQVGHPNVTSGQVTISPASIASAETVGAPVVSVGAVTVTPYGIAPAETVGNPAVTPGPVTVTAYGVSSSEQVGNPGVVNVQTVTGYSIRSSEAFGAVTVTSPSSRIVELSGVLMEPGRIKAAVLPGSVTVDLEEDR